MKTKAMLALVAALGALSLTVQAQDAGGPPQDGPGDGQGGHGKEARHPMPLIIGALDANHDGVIDAAEIANASAALKTLDKNGDGKLTREEFMGKPPEHQKNGKGGPGAHGGSENDGPQGPPPATKGLVQ